MSEQFRQYIISLYQSVPTSVYERLLSLFCLGVVILIAIKGVKKGCRHIEGLLLAEYVLLIFCSTVFLRKNPEMVGHNFSLFWSYEAIRNGREALIAENIMNVVVFVPVGMLLGAMVQGLWLKLRWALLITLIVGMALSLSIEALQFYFRKGFSEFDDVFHNTLGCLIGFMIFAVIKEIWQFCPHLLWPKSITRARPQ